jgi:Icc-related predicted phosphoesterase
MKALLLSDIHSSYRLLSAVSELKRSSGFDLVVFAGDAVDMGEPVGFIEELIWTIDELNAPFFWVPGNNDFGRAYHKLVARHKSLEGRVIEFAGRSLTGVGGSPASWAGQYQGERSVDKKAIAGTVFVSHVPPPGIAHYEKFDRVNPKSQTLNTKQTQNSKLKTQNYNVSNFENLNLGIISDLDIRNSNLQRKIIDFPLVHICGHIHHTWGVGYLGDTKVIKLAGAYLGYYAIMDLENLHVDFERFWK